MFPHNNTSQEMVKTAPNSPSPSGVSPKGLISTCVASTLQNNSYRRLICSVAWNTKRTLLNRGYPAKRALSAMRKHGG